MNRRNLALLLIAVLIFTMAACRAKQPEETIETTPATIPGVAENIFSEEDILMAMEDATESQETLGVEETTPVDQNNTEDATETTKSTEDAQVTESTKATEVTQATEPVKSTEATESTKPTESTRPTESTNATEATQTTQPTEATQPPQGGISLSGAAAEYARYNAMAPDEQVAFYNTFDSMEAFVAWYNNAKAEYDRQNPSIEIGNGNIDIGDLIG